MADVVQTDVQQKLCYTGTVGQPVIVSVDKESPQILSLLIVRSSI